MPEETNRSALAQDRASKMRFVDLPRVREANWGYTASAKRCLAFSRSRYGVLLCLFVRISGRLNRFSSHRNVGLLPNGRYIFDYSMLII